MEEIHNTEGDLYNTEGQLVRRIVEHNGNRYTQVLQSDGSWWIIKVERVRGK